MKTKEGYKRWAKIYDTNENKTRDLEKKVAQTTLKQHYPHIIELGCGTGKNTAWLLNQAESMVAVDFSEPMLQIAQEKIQNDKVSFKIADITQKWDFVDKPANLITCSLILEHIEALTPVFEQVYQNLLPQGQFYLCEYHPFKQYMGKRAKFEIGEETIELERYIHNVSEYLHLAQNQGFTCLSLQEHFDDNDTKNVPRLLSLLFEKA